MLYDLSFLGKGKIFPPMSEMERLEGYRQNKLLFEHRLKDVFNEYNIRVRQIINKFNDTDWAQIAPTIYSLDMDYFELLSIKTADLTVGDPPTVTMKKRSPTPEEIENEDDAAEAEHDAAEENLRAICANTGLFIKLLPIVVDISRFGDSVVRIYTEVKDGAERCNFTIISPEMWFPVVDREIKENRLCDVLAWVECVDPEEENEHRRRYVLHAQIHTAGEFENREYDVKKVDGAYTLPDGSNCRAPRFKIEGERRRGGTVSTGLSASAVRNFTNVVASDSIFGINDYDRISAVVAELGIRYTLEALVLDKHTAPTMAADEDNFFMDQKGQWNANIGGVMKVSAGAPYPQYITWDASLQANHTMIEKLEKHLYSLSEMGAVLNDDSFGASQGFEALETRMTNARLKARRISSLMITPLKELISLLSEKGYKQIPVSELSVQFNDGLPLTENQEVTIALKKSGNTQLEDISTILQEHLGKSKEEADAIAELLKSSSLNAFAGFGAFPPERNEESGGEEMTPTNGGEVAEDGEGRG